MRKQDGTEVFGAEAVKMIDSMYKRGLITKEEKIRDTMLAWEEVGRQDKMQQLSGIEVGKQDKHVWKELGY